MGPTVAIVGDSYIHRLDTYLQANHIQNLDLAQEKVVFLGNGGASVWGHKPVVRQLQDLMDMRSIEIVYLHIGSNDLCNRQCTPKPQYIPCRSPGKPSRLAWNIYSLAKYVLWGSSAKVVIMGQIIPRLRRPHHLYNRWVSLANHEMYCLV
jgi:hypothetical protein